MPKHPPEMIEAACKLRSEGLSYDKIAKELGISSMTVKRWNKRGYFKGGSNKDNKNNEKGSNNQEGKDNERNVNSNNNKEGSDSNKGMNTNIDTKYTHAAFHTADGSIVIGLHGKPIEKRIDPNKERFDPDRAGERGITPGLGQSSQVGHITEKPDIDAPENVMDKFFTRGTIEILAPVGLLLAGFLMSGKKGEKGEFRDQRGGGDW